MNKVILRNTWKRTSRIQRILKHSLPSMKRRSIRWVTTSAIYSATFWKKWTHWMDFCGSRD